MTPRFERPGKACCCNTANWTRWRWSWCGAIGNNVESESPGGPPCLFSKLDPAHCAFPVPVMKETQGSNRSTQASVLPATQALPDAFLGAEEALRDEDGSPDWLGNRLMPQDISFVEMVLLDRLRRRPFHTVRLEGPVD